MNLSLSVSEIDITHLFATDSAFSPFDCSNNAATLGDNAMQLTWQASVETARETEPLLDSDERKEAFREFVKSSGGWTWEEIRAWSDEELSALLLQWIAGDVREAFGDEEFDSWDWDEYQAQAEAGRISSRLFRTDSGRVFFYIGN